MAADTAAGRIMELSKKNRELTADLESERNKLRQMTKKMKEMEREVPTCNNEVLHNKLCWQETSSATSAIKAIMQATCTWYNTVHIHPTYSIL